MTTPRERTQAIKFAAEFMKKIVEMQDAPEILREEARHILRHYPNESQIDSIAAHVARSDLSQNLLEPTAS
ncbi:MAG TPA: BPSL0761 family protein [Noviherbaspirillum sp.]